jgi:ArsR family transcriptional regulator, arsenate/arsenite/antimonite-responsive transcriptional repressor
MKQQIRIFKALGDQSRIRILKMLEIRPLCVCEITDVLNLATSTVSKHLSLLRDAGLILDEKEGKWVNYKLNNAPDNDMVTELLSLVNKMIEDKGEIEKDKEKVNKADRYVICEVYDINLNRKGLK